MGRKSRLKQTRKCERVFNIDGTESIILNDEATDALKEQLELFKSTFGREPIGDEPVFFDPTITDKPTRLTEEKINEIILNQLKDIGAPENFIYAYKKTGRLVTEMNEHLLTKEEYKEWEDAVKEYDSTHND